MSDEGVSFCKKVVQIKKEPTFQELLELARFDEGREDSPVESKAEQMLLKQEDLVEDRRRRRRPLSSAMPVGVMAIRVMYEWSTSHHWPAPTAKQHCHTTWPACRKKDGDKPKPKSPVASPHRERSQSPAGGKRSQTPAAGALSTNNATVRHSLNSQPHNSQDGCREQKHTK